MGSFFLPALLFLMVVPATADGGRPVDRPASRVNDHLWWRQPVRRRRAQPGPEDNGPRTRFVRDEDEKREGQDAHKKKDEDKSAHHDTPTTTARATQSRLPPSSSETSTSTSTSASASTSASTSTSSSSSSSSSSRSWDRSSGALSRSLGRLQSRAASRFSWGARPLGENQRCLR